MAVSIITWYLGVAGLFFLWDAGSAKVFLEFGKRSVGPDGSPVFPAHLRMQCGVYSRRALTWPFLLCKHPDSLVHHLVVWRIMIRTVLKERKERSK